MGLRNLVVTDRSAANECAQGLPEAAKVSLMANLGKVRQDIDIRNYWGVWKSGARGVRRGPDRRGRRCHSFAF